MSPAALAAFALFVAGGIVQGSQAHVNAWVSPIALICYGLACLVVSGRVKS